MNLQYLADYQGNVTGVFIPIQEWDTIRKQLHWQELLEAFEQMKLMKQGKLRKPDLNEFLNELNEL